jgi:hypothetical protein
MTTKPEPDSGLGQRAFGPEQVVGAALLEDEWIKQAIAILEARPPKDEQPEKPAKKKTERDLEEAVARIARTMK